MLPPIRRMSNNTTLRIVSPHQTPRLTIYMMKMRNTSSPTSQSLINMKKAATDLSAARETFDSTVADMDLSSIK